MDYKIFQTEIILTRHKVATRNIYFPFKYKERHNINARKTESPKHFKFVIDGQLYNFYRDRMYRPRICTYLKAESFISIFSIKQSK